MPTISITHKLALSISILVLVAIGVLTTVLLSSQSRLIKSHSYDFSTLITEQLARNAIEPLFTDETYALQSLVDKIAASERILGAGFYDLNGKLLADSGHLPELPQLQFNKPYQELELSLPAELQHASAASVFIEPVRFRGATAGYAIATFSQSMQTQSLNRALGWIAGVTSALFLAICVTVLILSRHMTQPIKELVTATQHIRDGKFQPVSVRRHDEFGVLINAVNDMGASLNHKTRLEQLMDQMLTKGVAHEVIETMVTEHAGGQQVQASVLFADIVGFTNISESLTPREVSGMLNEYFNYLESCASAYFGTIDKFIGDCVMVVFGSPKEDPQHEIHAAACAVLMQKLVARLNERRREAGLFEINLRIGINSGQMLAGILGSNNRMEYTVVGDSVNLASRLCNEAESSQIIIEDSFYQRLTKLKKVQVSDEREIRIRGKSKPVSIFNVEDIEQMNPFLMENLIDDLLNKQSAA